MIPPFESATGLLPAGTHEATWEEFVARFGWTPYRLMLLAGLKAALDALRLAGCRRVYINGSFVTVKQEPGDFDACWEPAGVDLDVLDPVLLTFDPYRRAQKAKYGGELFQANMPADVARTTFLAFFQRSRDGRPKGIVALDLGALP